MGEKKGIRKGLIITLAIVVAVVGLMALAATAGMGAVRRTHVAAVNLSRIADGTYNGSFGAGRFQFAVTVDVTGSRITAVALQDPARENAMSRAIAAAIIDKQTVVMDAVSGASLTTMAFTKAVENALHGR